MVQDSSFCTAFQSAAHRLPGMDGICRMGLGDFFNTMDETRGMEDATRLGQERS